MKQNITGRHKTEKLVDRFASGFILILLLLMKNMCMPALIMESFILKDRYHGDTLLTVDSCSFVSAQTHFFIFIFPSWWPLESDL